MAIKNLASGTLAESVSASATTLLVYVGNGSASTIKGVWPTPPFYATIMPSNPTAGVPNSLDSEIVKVTAVGNDQVGNTALTVVRGQKGSATQAFAEGAIVTNAGYVEEAVLLGDEGTSETETPWIDAASIIWSTMVDKIYPVGSIYMSASLSTPEAVGNVLGGTWTAWGAGRVPVGVDTTQTEFNTVEKTGGAKTHTLKVDEIPAHSHGAYYTGSSTQPKSYGWYGQSGSDMAYDAISTGGGGAHNNLQPYIACYMYKRTA